MNTCLILLLTVTAQDGGPMRNNVGLGGVRIRATVTVENGKVKIIKRHPGGSTLKNSKRKRA